MGTSTSAAFGRRVAECRDRLGWTQRRLADEAQLSVPFVSDLENGKRTPGADALLRLAEALGVTMDYLVKGGVAAPPPTRQPLILPPQLAEVADEDGWSVADAINVLKYHEMVVARRSPTGEDAARTLTKEEWRTLREWLRGSPIQ